MIDFARPIYIDGCMVAARFLVLVVMCCALLPSGIPAQASGGAVLEGTGEGMAIAAASCCRGKGCGAEGFLPSPADLLAWARRPMDAAEGVRPAGVPTATMLDPPRPV